MVQLTLQQYETFVNNNKKYCQQYQTCCCYGSHVQINSLIKLLFTIIIPCGKINSHCQQCCNLDLECFYNAFFLKYNVFNVYNIVYNILSLPSPAPGIKHVQPAIQLAGLNVQRAQHSIHTARQRECCPARRPCIQRQLPSMKRAQTCIQRTLPCIQCAHVYVSEIILRCRFSYLWVVLQLVLPDAELFSCPVTVQQTYVGFCCLVEDLFQVCCQNQPIWLPLLD